jgi:tRNA-specific 2-thiouridylase
MRVLVAMSGGVDSSVAAALVRDAGHEVTGATMKLWGGPSDTGCCSVADVDDARRVAQQLGIDHFTFGFADDFELDVVAPYVAAHAEGRTPNPCIECNRHLKFDRFLRRADALGFDAIATGHHARVTVEGGRAHLRRGTDRAKDQSYVLHVLRQESLRRVLLPVGELSKADVRAVAATMGLRTAGKPDSQDVCFIPSVGGRAAFLGPRLRLTPGTVVDGSGAAVGSVPAVQLVTVGQRRGLGLPGGGPPRFATAVDVRTGTVTVGSAADLLCDEVAVEGMGWVDGPVAGDVEVQVSAHGEARAARLEPAAGDAAVVHLAEPVRRVAPGQSVVVYRGDEVLGGGTAA